jgi:RND family efflux transporter MFP subunit
VGVIEVSRHPISRDLTLSSELVPFQEIDVFAKESGYVSKLLVDYGSRVRTGQLLAVLEIPELQIQLDQDRASIKSVSDEVTNAEHQLSRIEAQHQVLHLQYQRFASVAQSKPGLVAQQEVDEVQGRDLAAESQVEAARSSVEAAKSNLIASQAKLARDQAIYGYSRITAPFDGIVTQRYANLGMLLASGTNTSTQAMPVVRLSQVDRFRLVIPVSENYVRYVRIGDPLVVRVPSLNKIYPGEVTRFSSDVHDATRTMHTEVDIPNKDNQLIPGLYAEATLTLNRSPNALTIPVQAIDRESNRTTVAIVNAQGRVEIRPVTIGMETESEVEIVSGLSEGDRVIATERAGLNPGQTVRTQPIQIATYTNKG